MAGGGERNVDFENNLRGSLMECVMCLGIESHFPQFQFQSLSLLNPSSITHITVKLRSCVFVQFKRCYIDNIFTIFSQQNHRWLFVIGFNFNSILQKIIENELNGINRAGLALKYKIKTQPNQLKP